MRWLTLLLLCGVAHAAGPQWQFRLEGNPKPGQKAALVLVPQNDVYEVEVALSSGGTRKTFTAKKIAAGEARRFAWSVPAGESRWTGTLTGSADGATTTAPLDLKVVAVGPLDVHLDKRDIDLANGRILVVPTRALRSAEVAGFDAAGDQVLVETVDLAGQPAKRTVVAFEVPEGAQVKRVELKLHDHHGYWAALRIASWYAEIAHDDVEFETGKWAVRPEEGHKIDAAIEALHAELARFEKQLPDEAVDAKVYVGGYTDTVGSPADNRKLSLERARAIARYLRGHGVKLPIYYQGFGERALAVPTADNVDEARNRRAIYVLANVPPTGAKFPGGGWKRLK